MKVELFRAGGRSVGHDGLVVAFRNFANAPKNYFNLCP